jgi:hypothetical protein
VLLFGVAACAPSGAPPHPGSGGDAGATTASAGKRGIAYGFRRAADLDAFGSSVSWWYNWSPKPDAGAGAGGAIEFVPMVWGGNFDVNQLAAEIPANARFLLGFNEPNFGTQANLTPTAAAALWPKLEDLAQRRGLSLVSPALNYCGGNCNETDPFVWLDQFFAACTGCRVDYIAMHWYACSKAALTWYLGQYKTKYSQPLWLTEFACLDSPASATQEAQYMNDALNILEAEPRLFRYSWFTGRFSGNAVVDLLAPTAGQLTPLGQAYVAFPAAH